MEASCRNKKRNKESMLEGIKHLDSKIELLKKIKLEDPGAPPSSKFYDEIKFKADHYFEVVSSSDNSSCTKKNPPVTITIMKNELVSPTIKA